MPEMGSGGAGQGQGLEGDKLSPTICYGGGHPNGFPRSSPKGPDLASLHQLFTQTALTALLPTLPPTHGHAPHSCMSVSIATHHGLGGMGTPTGLARLGGMTK